MIVHRGITVRRDAGLYGYEHALARAGFTPVAGADEAGRGACAGPLVVAAVILPGSRHGRHRRNGVRSLVPGLADSKLLTGPAREEVYAEVVARAHAWSVIVIPPGDVDRVGLHRSNVAGMRRALARLAASPAYVLTDGFPVTGLGTPGLAVWKGDRVAACIAAASVVAKVTRDRIMRDLHERFPVYDFAAHKGYVTVEHQEALLRYGPCPEHRFSYANVQRSLSRLPPHGPVHRPVHGRQIDDSGDSGRAVSVARGLGGNAARGAGATGNVTGGAGVTGDATGACAAGDLVELNGVPVDSA